MQINRARKLLYLVPYFRWVTQTVAIRHFVCVCVCVGVCVFASLQATVDIFKLLRRIIRLCVAFGGQMMV